MKIKSNFNIISLSLLTGVLLNACKPDALLYEPAEWVKIYMPQAKDKPALRSFVMADTMQTIVYGAAYGGPDYPNNDVEIRFKVDPALAQSFNSENGTAYPIMPAGSYELNMETTIRKGKLNTLPLKIKVKTIGAIEPVKEYILPVSIEQVSGGLKVNESLRTTYFIVKAAYLNYSRSAWTVAGVSSQNSVIEGIDKAFDDNVNTFWHSQYTPVRPGPPHFITVNMSETKTLHGFSFSARRNAANGRFKSIRIQVSMNGADWQDAGSFTLANVDENTVYLSSPREAKFFKVWIDESHGNITCSLAELRAF